MSTLGQRVQLFLNIFVCPYDGGSGEVILLIPRVYFLSYPTSLFVLLTAVSSLLPGIGNRGSHDDEMYWFRTVVFIRASGCLCAYHTSKIKWLTVLSALQKFLQ